MDLESTTLCFYGLRRLLLKLAIRFYKRNLGVGATCHSSQGPDGPTTAPFDLHLAYSRELSGLQTSYSIPHRIALTGSEGLPTKLVRLSAVQDDTLDRIPCDSQLSAVRIYTLDFKSFRNILLAMLAAFFDKR